MIGIAFPEGDRGRGGAMPTIKKSATLIIKKLPKQPLSSADAHEFMSSFIRTPPLPKEWIESGTNTLISKNETLLDYWRRLFGWCLDETTSEKSWDLQKTKLITRILTEQEWRVAYTVAKDAKWVNSWAHWVEGNEFFQNWPREKWPLVLLQRWFLGILTEAGLLELACKYFRIDGTKQMEIMLYYEYEKEIKALDFTTNEIMWNNIDVLQDSEILEMARMKDEVVSPLITEQYKLLALMREQICNSTLDATETNQRMQAFTERKHAIAATLQAGTHGYQF
jgi:hypothetical protein